MARLKFVVYIFLVTLAMALVPSVAFASDVEAPVVKVGYFENEVFQEGARPDAMKRGYAYEYYRKMSEYTGWSYEYVYGDFADVYQMLLDGKVDLLAGLARTEERLELIGYPEAPMGNESYYLVRHATDDTVTTDPATFSHKRIGVLESALLGELKNYLSQNNVDADVISYTDYGVLFAAFDNDEVDLIAAEGDGAYHRQDAEVVCSFGSSDYYLCVSKERPDLLAALNEAQAQLSVDEPNYLISLRSKYYASSLQSTSLTPSEAAWVSSHDVMHVGYLNRFLPFSDTNERGETTGLVSNVLPLIIDKLNITKVKLDYQGFDSYADMIAAVNEGDIDVAFPAGGGLYYSEENGIYLSNPVITSTMELVYVGDYADARTAHFAINERNDMQRYYVQTFFPDAEVTTYPSIDACLSAVLSGEVDCTTLNGLRAKDILRNSKYETLSTRQLPNSDDSCFGVLIGNDGLLKLLNRGINVIGQEYSLDRAYAYTNELYVYTAYDFLRDHMAFIGTLALAIACFVILLLMRDSRRSKARAADKEAARKVLEEKNAELAESQVALSNALVATEEASRAKTVFLNNISHDIRTPMNAIVGYTTLAQTHIDDTDQVQDYLARISVSSQHLLSLINDVLDMSRIESGRIVIEKVPTHLPDLVRDITDIVQADVSTKHQDLLVDATGIKHEDVIADRLRLNQILLNILSNAMKFTPEHGRIHLCVTEREMSDEQVSDYEFRIRDNGIGMSEEFQKTIFDPFTRERTSTVSGIQGTGLGMAITRNIVDMMGGSIEVNSAPGEGTEFVVILPLELSDASVEAEPVLTPSDGTSFEGKRILLVEDNELNQDIALVILEEEGFSVDVAGDGVEAVRMMEDAPTGTYDIILMDIQMPNMDGYEATRRIRALEDADKAQTPIIAMTANAFQEDREFALGIGMNDHLAKPYNIDDMMQTIARHLS